MSQYYFVLQSLHKAAMIPVNETFMRGFLKSQESKSARCEKRSFRARNSKSWRCENKAFVQDLPKNPTVEDVQNEAPQADLDARAK